MTKQTEGFKHGLGHRPGQGRRAWPQGRRGFPRTEIENFISIIYDYTLIDKIWHKPDILHDCNMKGVVSQIIHFDTEKSIFFRLPSILKFFLYSQLMVE